MPVVSIATILYDPDEWMPMFNMIAILAEEYNISYGAGDYAPLGKLNEEIMWYKERIEGRYYIPDELRDEWLSFVVYGDKDKFLQEIHDHFRLDGITIDGVPLIEHVREVWKLDNKILT